MCSRRVYLEKLCATKTANANGKVRKHVEVTYDLQTRKMPTKNVTRVFCL